MTTTHAIEIAGLTKSYGDHAVLKGVDLSGSGRPGEGDDVKGIHDRDGVR